MLVQRNILAAFRELNDVDDGPQSVVAHRYRSDGRRKQPTPPPKRARAVAGGGRAVAGGGEAITATRTPDATPKPSYATIVISDSEDLEELENGGASSSD